MPDPIDTHFDRLVEAHFDKAPAGLYEPVRYILASGGKRMRPRLVLLGADLGGGDPQAALTNAFGIELFHNFTLVHDDIMDKADVRRGHPAVHARYGLNAGILSGDLMVVKALQLAADRNGAVDPGMFRLMVDTATEIYEGQQLDVDFEDRTDTSADDYIEMIRLKTAVLLGCALQLGAMTADAPADVQHALYRFGNEIGLAFQIRDDVLDAFGDDRTGKVVGGDILNNKKTLLVIRARDLGSEAERAALMSHMASTDRSRAKVDAVRDLFEATGARADVEARMTDHFDRAMALLEDLDAPAGPTDRLRTMARTVIERMS